MERIIKPLLIAWCFVIFAVVLVACAAQEQQPKAQVTFPIGDAWHKLTLYEKEQVVERYEKSKRAPYQKKSLWSLFDSHPDLQVTVSWREHDPSGQPKAEHYDLMLRDGACETVRLGGLVSSSRKANPLKFCWSRAQLNITTIDASDDAQHASVQIQSHPMWPFGLRYPHLKLSDSVGDLSVYVRSQTSDDS
jgi:hypothetical protein